MLLFCPCGLYTGRGLYSYSARSAAHAWLSLNPAWRQQGCWQKEPNKFDRRCCTWNASKAFQWRRERSSCRGKMELIFTRSEQKKRRPMMRLVTALLAHRSLVVIRFCFQGSLGGQKLQLIPFLERYIWGSSTVFSDVLGQIFAKEIIYSRCGQNDIFSVGAKKKWRSGFD